MVLFKERELSGVESNRFGFVNSTEDETVLLMQEHVLHLYGQGYSNFLFLIKNRQTEVRLRKYFLDTQSSQYFLKQHVTINNKAVGICEVNSFIGTDQDAINIIFTTLEGFYVCTCKPRENVFSFKDFKEGQFAILSEEGKWTTRTKKKLGKTVALHRRIMVDWILPMINKHQNGLLLRYATMPTSNK